MRVLIAGYNDTSRFLIENITSFAQVTLLEKEERKELLEKENLENVELIFGDVSDIETLKQLVSRSFNTLVACFEEDRANYSLCKFLLNHIPNKIALINLEVNEKLYDDIKDKVTLVYKGKILGKFIKNLINQDKKECIALGIGGDIVELKVLPNSILVDQKVSNFSSNKWKIVAIYRDNKIILPTSSTKISSEDRLLIVGDPSVLKNIIHLFLRNEPQFPLSYGYAQVAIVEDKEPDKNFLSEVLFLYSKTKVREVDFYLNNTDINIKSLEGTLGSIEINKLLSYKFISSLDDVDIGFITLKKNFSRFQKFSFIFSAENVKPIKYFKKYKVPVFLCTGKAQYENILCPVFDMEDSIKALELSFQLAKMIKANLTILIINHLDMNDENFDLNCIKKNIDACQRMYDLTPKIIYNTGNPVTLSVKMSKNFDLVITSGKLTQDSNLFKPYPPYLIFLMSQSSSLLIPYQA